MQPCANSTIQRNLRAGNETCGVRCEEEGERCDFLWLADSPCRVHLPELIQRDATAQRIFLEASALLDDPAKAAATRAELLKVRRSLGEPGAADRAAAAVQEAVA